MLDKKEESSMKAKGKSGRPIVSNNVRLIPEFYKDPDIEKLGRALIAVAIRIAEKKKAEEESLNKSDECTGDQESSDTLSIKGKGETMS